MRKLALLLWFLLSVAVAAQIPTTTTPVPDPPPLVPIPIPGEPAPFDPNQTKEAVPEPPLELRNPAPAAPEAPQGPIGLLQAVELALRLQPDLQAARGSLTQAEGTVVQQRANLLPRLNLSSTFSHSSTRQDGGGVDSATLVNVGSGTVEASSGTTTDRLSSS